MSFCAIGALVLSDSDLPLCFLLDERALLLFKPMNHHEPYSLFGLANIWSRSPNFGKKELCYKFEAVKSKLRVRDRESLVQGTVDLKILLSIFIASKVTD